MPRTFIMLSLSALAAGFVMATQSGCPTCSGPACLALIEECPTPLSEATCPPLESFESGEQDVLAAITTGFNLSEALIPVAYKGEASSYFAEALKIWNDAWSAFLDVIAASDDAINDGSLTATIDNVVNAINEILCIVNVIEGSPGDSCVLPFPVSPIPIEGADAGDGEPMTGRVTRSHAFDELRLKLAGARDAAETFRSTLR